MAVDGRMPYSGMNTPPRWDNWKPARRRRWVRNNAPPGLGRTPAAMADFKPVQGADYPAPQAPPPAFMPHMPSYEAGLRGLEDQYASGKTSLEAQLNLIGPQVQQQEARMATDKGYENSALDETLLERGVFNSGTNNFLRQRDIDIPYGRQGQDLAQWAGSEAAAIQNALAELALQYNQGMAELILNNAAEAASSMPPNVPQFSEGYQPVQPNWKPPRKRKGNGKRGG